MIDNFDELKQYLTFTDETFYFLQILSRRKDNPNQSKDSKVIRDYIITSESDLDEIKSEVISLCDTLNARAYLRLNRRSYEKAAFDMQRRLLDIVEQKQYKSVTSLSTPMSHTKSIEDSVDKKWIVDIDHSDYPHVRWFSDDVARITRTIEMLHANSNNESYKIYGNVITKNGMHIITNPFNLLIFKKMHPIIHVHKDNPTILYCPS